MADSLNDVRELTSAASTVEATMRIRTDSVTSFSLGIESVRRVVSYAIKHYVTVRAVAWQALIDCGYMVEVTEDDSHA